MRGRTTELRNARVVICIHDPEAMTTLEHQIHSEYGQAEVRALLDRLMERATIEAEEPMTMDEALRELRVPDREADECGNVISDNLNGTAGFTNWVATPFKRRQFAEFCNLWCPDRRYAGSELEREVMFHRISGVYDLGVIVDAVKRIAVNAADEANPIEIREMACFFSAIARAVEESAGLDEEPTEAAA